MNEHERFGASVGTAQIVVRPTDYYAPMPDEDDTDGPPPGSVPDACMSQWSVHPDGVYRPASRTIRKLAAGAYMAGHDRVGMFLKARPIAMDMIIDLSDSASLRVMQKVKRFWDSEELYKKRGLLFKRGVLLWGPPGSGKTIAVDMTARDVIRRDGVVIFCEHPTVTVEAVTTLRSVEPRRKLVVVYEDIDEIIAAHGEHQILALLDGEHQTQNIVSIATTNYPERLAARIANRPSRFDDRIEVGMPSMSCRLEYLQSTAKDLPAGTLQQWALDTEGLSIAHLRELVVAVGCLGSDYSDTLERLFSMCERPRETDGFDKKQAGFTVKARRVKALGQ